MGSVVVWLFYGICAVAVIGLVCSYFEGETVWDQYLKSLSSEELKAKGYRLPRDLDNPDIWSREPVRRGDRDD